VLLAATVLALHSLWKATTGPVDTADPGTADRTDAASEPTPGLEPDAAIRTATDTAAQSAAQAPDLEPAGAAGAPTAGQSRGGGRD
jgi:hypothetical protein